MSDTSEMRRILSLMEAVDEPSAAELIGRACDAVWQGIAYDIPEDNVAAVEMVELATDADRLKTFGYPREALLFSS